MSVVANLAFMRGDTVFGSQLSALEVLLANQGGQTNFVSRQTALVSLPALPDDTNRVRACTLFIATRPVSLPIMPGYSYSRYHCIDTTCCCPWSDTHDSGILLLHVAYVVKATIVPKPPNYLLALVQLCHDQTHDTDSTLFIETIVRKPPRPYRTLPKHSTFYL